MGSCATSVIHGKYDSPSPSIGRNITSETGRNATNARLTRRTDQFHFALVIHVTTVSSIAPMAMFVKNSQFETYDCHARSASVVKAKTKPARPTPNIPRNIAFVFLERGRNRMGISEGT